MRYIALDGFVYGTGVRDIYTNEYLNVGDLNFSSDLKAKIEGWVTEYKRNQQKMNSVSEEINFLRLDDEGLELSYEIISETKGYKIDYYYSDHFGERKYLMPK